MKKKLLTLTLTIFTSLLWSQSSLVKIDAEKSNIHWFAKKVTGEHDGYINLVDGSLEMDGTQLTGGAFEVDMTTINVADLTGEYKNKLEKHLKSDDFFGVDKFPKSHLTFTEVVQKTENHYEIVADLTIKGITAPVSLEMHFEGNEATTKFMVNRAKYNVRYGSNSFFDNLGDKAIYDEFELGITLNY
ncbi:YceI family protein [Flavobacteriaceae bacterium]|jgi:polyisoprenoid-binding protein YceI|nr:YceI family protein [Flavobacteriaceae bacterium]MDA9587526.1 YceI family protein [Flavobacteriaceae bacterium]